MSHRAWGVARILAVAIVIAGVASAARAQTPVTTTQSPAHGTNVDFTIAGSFLTPVAMGSTPVDLLTPGGSPLTIANTSNKLGASFGIEGRLAFRLRKVTAEVMAGWDDVQFQTSVTGDSEGAADITVSQGVSRFTLGGSAVFSLSRRPKREVYALAGLSWLREASDLSAGGLYEDGALTEGGIGWKMWWRENGKGRIKRVGLRIEGRVGLRTGGINLDTKSVHIVPVIMAGLVIGS